MDNRPRNTKYLVVKDFTRRFMENLEDAQALAAGLGAEGTVYVRLDVHEEEVRQAAERAANRVLNDIDDWFDDSNR